MNKVVMDIKERQRKLNNQLKVIQDSCSHTDKVSKNGSNTGNYDPSADCYWVDHHCNDCDKRWTTR